MFTSVFARWPELISQGIIIVVLLVCARLSLVRVLLARLRCAYEGGTRGRKIIFGVASIAFLITWLVALALVWSLGVLLFVVGVALAVCTLAWSKQGDGSPALLPLGYYAKGKQWLILRRILPAPARKKRSCYER